MRRVRKVQNHPIVLVLNMEDLLAQLVEHHTFNVGVTSSSLVGVTSSLKYKLKVQQDYGQA